MICLDTNVVITALNGRIPIIRERLYAYFQKRLPVGLPVIAHYELLYGCARSTKRAQSEAQLQALLNQGITVLHFGNGDAQHAGDIRADLEKIGQPIGHYDFLIAAQARSRGATLVTANTREFFRVPGLIVEDWSQD